MESFLWQKKLNKKLKAIYTYTKFYLYYLYIKVIIKILNISSISELTNLFYIKKTKQLSHCYIFS